MQIEKLITIYLLICECSQIDTTAAVIYSINLLKYFFNVEFENISHVSSKYLTKRFTNTNYKK